MGCDWTGFSSSLVMIDWRRRERRERREMNCWKMVWKGSECCQEKVERVVPALLPMATQNNKRFNHTINYIPAYLLLP